MTMRDRCKRLQIAHVAGRIADGFAKHGPGVLVDQRLDVGGAVRFRESNLYPLFRQDMPEQRVGRAVELRDRDDVAPHLGDVDGRIVERRLARTRGERPDAALELSDPLLEHGGGGIADARVSESFDLEIEERGSVLRAVERIGGGLINRNRHRVGGGVRVESAVNRNRLFFHAGIAGAEGCSVARSMPGRREAVGAERRSLLELCAPSQPRRAPPSDGGGLTTAPAGNPSGTAPRGASR